MKNNFGFKNKIYIFVKIRITQKFYNDYGKYN